MDDKEREKLRDVVATVLEAGKALNVLLRERSPKLTIKQFNILINVEGKSAQDISRELDVSEWVLERALFSLRDDMHLIRWSGWDNLIELTSDGQRFFEEMFSDFDKRVSVVT